MTRKQYLQLIVAVLLFGAMGTALVVVPNLLQRHLGDYHLGNYHLVNRWGHELLTLRSSQLPIQAHPAQDRTAQDDVPRQGAEEAQDADQNDERQDQIFLPFVIDGDVIDGNVPDSEDEQPTDGHDHGRPLFESWPPQPIGIEAVAAVPVAPPESVAGAALLAGQDAMQEAEQIALASVDVQAALGEKFVHAATIRAHTKSTPTTAANAANAIRIVYFSYTNNQTVEALVVQGAVTAIYVSAAADYQPEPTNEERNRAIDLARTHFLTEGEQRVAELQGYVIMAYRSNGRTGFYGARVVYVTFHQGLDERPEYLAWVDLTNETILKATADSLAMHAAKQKTAETTDQGDDLITDTTVHTRQEDQ